MIKSISWNPIFQVMGIFFIQPVVLGVWLALIPKVQSGLNLDTSQLALGLMGTPAGMLMTLPFAGKMANTFGIRKILYIGFPVYFFPHYFNWSGWWIIQPVTGPLPGRCMRVIAYTCIERSCRQSRKTY